MFLSVEFRLSIFISLALFLLNLNKTKGQGNFYQALKPCSYQDYQRQFPCGDNQLYKHLHSKCIFFGQYPKPFQIAKADCEARQGYILANNSATDLLQRWRRIYPPSLKVFYSGGYEKEFNGGDDIFATCQGFVGMDGKLFFMIKNNKGEEKFYRALHDEIIYRADREYVMNGNRCDRRSEISFIKTATKDLSGQTLTCCVESSATYLSCSQDITINLKYAAKTPRLQIQYHSLPSFIFLGYRLKAMCTAYIELSAGKSDQLFMYFEGRRKNLRSTVFEEEFDPRRGLKRSILVEKLIKEHHNNSRLACGTSADSVESEPLLVIRPPSTPKLKVHLHKPPKWVVNGRQLNMSCSVIVHHESWLAWEMTTVTRTFIWDSPNSGSVESKGRVALIDNRRQANGTTGAVTLTSSFKIDVDSEFDGSGFSCRVRLSNTRAKKGEERGNLEFSTRSRILRVFYNPQKPKLEIGYPGESEPVVANRMIPVSCSGLVGSEGALTVGTIGSASPFVWVVHIDGSTRTHKQNSKLNILKNTRVVMDRFGGPKITIHVHMWFAKEDEGAVLHCFSHDTFSNFIGAAGGEEENELHTSFKLIASNVFDLKGRIISSAFAACAATVILSFILTLCWLLRRNSKAIPDSVQLGEGRVSFSPVQRISLISNFTPSEAASSVDRKDTESISRARNSMSTNVTVASKASTKKSLGGGSYTLKQTKSQPEARKRLTRVLSATSMDQVTEPDK